MSRSILIDTVALTFLKACDCKDSIERLDVWAEILCPYHNYIIVGVENRWYSCFSLAQVKSLYYNATGTHHPSHEYQTVLRAVAEIGASMEVDDTPLDDLLKKLGRPMRKEPPAGGSVLMKQVHRSKEKPKPTVPSSVPKSEPQRPKPGSKTGIVWEAADRLLRDLGRLPTKQEVLEACVPHDINVSTVGVQYGKWKKVHDST